MASIWKVKKNNTTPRRVVRFFFNSTEIHETEITELGTDFATEQAAKAACSAAGLPSGQYGTIEYVEQ